MLLEQTGDPEEHCPQTMALRVELDYLDFVLWLIQESRKQFGTKTLDEFEEIVITHQEYADAQIRDKFNQLLNTEEK